MENDTSTQQVSEEVQKTLELAKNEIEEVLKKHKVSLVPVIIHHGDKSISRIDILPVQEEASK
jgi:hypothetical protein